MSKLYKDLRYDTDRVMQPGDPLTSFDGNTAIKAGNATGKGFIETYGDPVAYSYEVTVDVPQAPGASCRVRIDDTNNTTMDITILDIFGWPEATASGSDISVNGSLWGGFYAASPWSDDVPPSAVIPTETASTYNTIISCYHGDDQQLCTSWSNLVKTRQTTSKEISTVGHTHGLIQTNDGTTKVKAVNSGKGFIETYGDAINHYYDVTVDIPQVPGASARIRLKDVDETSIGVEILSIEGFPGAEIDNNSSAHIKLNGASWGYVNCSPAWEGSTYPDYTIIPIGYGGKIYVEVNPEHTDSEYCHWSELEQTRQLLSSKEIIAAAEQAANKVLASPSTGTGAVSFRSLVAADIPNLNTSKLTAGTLEVARGGTGKSSHTVNSILAGNASSTTGTIQNIPTVSGALYATAVNGQASFGTLPIAQGGTGATTAAAALTALGAAGADHTHSLLKIGTDDTYKSLVLTNTGALRVNSVSPGSGTAIKDPEARDSSTNTVLQINGQTDTAAANTVLAGPTSGSAAAWSFRSLVAADIPTLSTSKISGLGDAATKNVGTASGTVAAGDHTHSSLYSGNSDTNSTLALAQGGDVTITKSSIATGGLLQTVAPRGVITAKLAERPASSTENNFAALTSTGNLKDSGKKAADFATSDHTHSSLKSGSYTASLPTLTANKTLALSDHTHAVYSIPYTTCSTSESNTTKVASIQDGKPFSLTTGAMVLVTFTNKQGSNTNSSITLNVASSGAKTILPKIYWGAGETLLFYYDGINWVPIKPQNIVTTDTPQIISGSKIIQSVSGATQFYVGNLGVSGNPEDLEIVVDSNGAYLFIGGTNEWLEYNSSGFKKQTETTEYTLLIPEKNGTLAVTGDLNILPITTSTATTLALDAGTYMYKVTDSGATGTFPTLTAPTGLPADCYYKFEMEWVTASPTATYAQTASTTPAMKWISSPVMQTDGLSHTYHISGRYDTTTNTFWMSCWKIDDAQGTITPDAHTLKYLLTTPTQTTSTTTNANDTITVQLSDHAINTVNVPVSVTNVVLKFPGQAVGKARDFFVRLIVTGSTVPSITLTEPDGSAIDFDVDDDSWTEIEQGVNLLMFTETAQ